MQETAHRSLQKIEHPSAVLPGKNSSLSVLENILKKRISASYKKILQAYTFSIAISMCFVGIALLVSHVLDKSFLLLLALNVILLSAWYGGIFPGILTMVLLSIGLTYFIFSPKNFIIYDPFLFSSLILFMVTGAIISYVIERVKNHDAIAEFRKNEELYREIVLKQKEQLLLAKDEIKARDEFLSLASHELRTPLTAMLLQIQTILHNIKNVSLANFSVENLLRMLTSAEQQTTRLSKMINDLLNTSLITTGRLTLEKEQVNITDLIYSILDHFSEKLKKENITVTFSDGKDIVGNWDKFRIEQVITNLLTNAIKYGNGKPIHIDLQKKSNMAILKITDQGIGIPEKLQKKIFERFERAVDGRQYEGLGVGLYITSQIIKEHNGKIHVESKVGDGSTFIIELPLS